MKFVKINAWMIICLLMATPLVVGILTFHAYGESIDESGLRAYSDYSLNAYRGILGGDFNPDLGQANYRYYGPASLMAENLFVKFLYFVTIRKLVRMHGIWQISCRFICVLLNCTYWPSVG